MPEYFRVGIGPFNEKALVKNLVDLLKQKGYSSRTAQTPDLIFGAEEWALEVKIVRPYGDNDKKAESWSVNLLHPYEGNTSAIGDAFKLKDFQTNARKAIFVIGYEHNPAKIFLDPLIEAFEVVAKTVCRIPFGKRIEEKRNELVNPAHQVLRCFAWEIH